MIPIRFESFFTTSLLMLFSFIVLIDCPTFAVLSMAIRGFDIIDSTVSETLKGLRTMAIFRATDIFEMAMELEKSGEIFYDAVAKKATSPDVRALFEELAQQEKRHREILEGVVIFHQVFPGIAVAQVADYNFARNIESQQA